MLFHKERSISVIWTAAVLVAWAVVSSAPMAGAQPPQDAMIRGEVTESGTGLPVPNALVRVEAGALVNETYTNATGDYEMWLAAGSYNFIIVSGAHYLYFESFSIGSGETLWKNATIFPAPPRDANIRGFVNDTDTGDPVTWGRMVGVEQTQGYANFSWMDSVTGYYEMDVIAGDFQVFTDSVDGYWYWETSITLGSGTIYWLNLSLTPLPPANSTIWGYAYDASSGLPIENALIQLVINSTYQNYTYTNASGYYSFSVFSGNVEMMASAPGYTSDSASFSIGVDETIRQDFNLSALNAVVYGYVNDTSTGLGVPSAVVNANEMTGLFWNQTLTDGTGYYEMWLVAGDYWLDAWAPGYIGNSTTFSIAAYEVKRVDLGLTPVPPQNSTVRGYVNDSSTLLPISGAWVEIYNSTLGYWNGTSTDVTGYYEMNTPAGELQVQASATGYFSSWTIVTVADGASAWANLSLVPETSVVQGFVYDADTLAPIGGAWLSVTNSSGYWNSTTTDPSGYYNMNTIAGDLTMFASATGYATATREFQILESEVLNLDFYLEPLSARIVVNVTDYLTGSPIAGAWVSAWNASFQWWTGNSTDASGQTWLDVIVDSLTVRVEAGGYYPTEIPVVTQADQTIYLDVQLYPVLSETAMIRGYVNDTLGNTLQGARIYASGYAEWESETVSDLTGYYELWVVPAPLTILATASLHGPGWANISLSDGEVMWLNFTLDTDTTPPSVTNLTSLPDASISTNNPATINATLVEKYLQNAGIAIGMYAESYLDQDNYTLILQYVLQADGGPFPTLPVDLWPTGPDTYEMGALWNGTTTGGWLGDGVSQEYLGAGYGDFGGTSYYVLFGRYDNSSTPSPIDTVAFFNDAGDLQFIIDMANGTFVDTSDPTAVFGAMKIMIFVNSTTLQLYGVAFDVDMWWSTASLVFNPEPLVPSGDYLVFAFGEDYGGNFGYNATVVMVDNDSPMANAGLDQTVESPTTFQFDGTSSTDNVAIVNYTWTFTYGGSDVTLYGATPSFQFSEPGTYLVTLTVSDAAGWSSQDTMSIVVQDTTPPLVGTPAATPDPQEVYQTVDFSVSVTDNYQVAAITIAIVDPDGVLVGNFTMTLVAGDYTYSTSFDKLGTYTFTIWASDTEGNFGSGVGQFIIEDTTSPVLGTPSASPSPQEVYQTVDFSVSVTDNYQVAAITIAIVDPDGVLVGNFTMTPAAGNYTYSTSFTELGTFSYTIWATDSSGNLASAEGQFVVQDTVLPVANAVGPLSVEVGEEISFDATGSTDNHRIVNYTWNFGDGTFGYGATPSHTYTAAGDYTVTLTVRDAAGNEATDTLTVTVQAVGILGISPILFWAIIGAILAIAVIVGILLWRRSK